MWRGRNGNVFLVSADDEAVLVAVSARGAKVGMMLFEIRRAAKALGEVLRVETVAEYEPDEDPIPAPPELLHPVPQGGWPEHVAEHARVVEHSSWADSRGIPQTGTAAATASTDVSTGADMKLEGSLDAFSLPDIFQLLSFTKKSGGLHLASDGSDGVVFFAGGQVTGASADGSRQPLVRRLIGAGAVDDDALVAAVQAATQGESVGVVKALLELGAVDAGLLRQAVADQSVDAVFDLLRWQQGDFAFVVEEINPDDVGVTVSIEAILADAESRRPAGKASRRSCRRPRRCFPCRSCSPTTPRSPAKSGRCWPSSMAGAALPSWSI